jgi:hypothetical protein
VGNLVVDNSLEGINDNAVAHDLTEHENRWPNVTWIYKHAEQKLRGF